MTIKSKVTQFEIVLAGIIVCCLLIFGLSMAFIGSAIEEAGGVRAIVVEAGKEVKSIVKEIEETP